MRPLLSIVTVCYDSESTITKTIDSVLNQGMKNYEYLIIDGGSTDRTVEIIKSYESRFEGKLKWISEKDSGWYDAMNKGIRMSNGLFINFLNSDDYLENEALKKVSEYINLHHISEDAIIYGDSTNVYQNSKGKIYYRKINAPEKLNIDNKGLKEGMCGIRHQSMFTGKQVFEIVGVLNLKYRIHADWDFLIKCLKHNIKMYHLKTNLTYYSMYGASSNPNYNERHLLRKNNGLYGVIDLDYFKDRWGIKISLKKILGDRKWNDLLFKIHEVRGH